MLLSQYVLFLGARDIIVTASVVKRWYSVQPLASHRPKGNYGPWPVIHTGKSDEVQPVRYCFADVRSQRNLQHVVDQAIARWHSAFLHSQLRIVPDTEQASLCDAPQVRSDALVIHDATRDGNTAWNHGPECPTDSASTGYNYASNERGRHRLDFCHLDPQDRRGTEPLAVQAMMHELGHAIGLQHEHQRQDRGQYLEFHCENLDGYEQAKRKAAVDERAYFEDDEDLETRMSLVCNDDEIASDYLPAALPFIRQKDHRLESEKTKFKYYVQSDSFDYDSIMIYNSHANTPIDIDATNPKTWVLKRKDGTAVWQGGSKRAADAKITEGDIARVAQLYLKAGGATLEATGLGKWDGQRVRKARSTI